jgi:hypothetical protein
MPRHVTAHRIALVAVVLAAALPYLPTLDNYFVQDDFGVVGLLSSKPAFFFPRWFVVPWMEDIWGYSPDELRPFVALTYQVAAQWNAGSPVLQHLLNVALHAGNALLVLAIAQRAAGLRLLPAAIAAVAFAVLPMQTESVAWVTGRVDSMPAFFYLLAFYLYVRWRQEGRLSAYAGSVAACFVALFSKQNTITLAPALLAYDVLLGHDAGPAEAGHYVRWRSLRALIPFVLLTAGYLLLRYQVFGQVARESMLSAARIDLFALDVSMHLRRMVFGEPGLSISTMRAATWVGACIAGVAATGALLARDTAARTLRPAAYFLVVWVVLGVAPTLVAGYASPRHMYLASVGWAVSLGLAFGVLWSARPQRVMRPVAMIAAAFVLAVYMARLVDEVRLWETRSMVSHRAVVDIEREATGSPPGTLIIAGAPRRSWDFALPHALRPPYTREDLTRRVTVVSDSSIHCCPAIVWEPYTRQALDAWLNRPDHPPVIALYWNPDTGVLSRVSDRDDPYLRSLMKVLLETRTVAALDEAIHDMLWALAAPRVVSR